VNSIHNIQACFFFWAINDFPCFVVYIDATSKGSKESTIIMPANLCCDEGKGKLSHVQKI
jgi:hypothetical protein